MLIISGEKNSRRVVGGDGRGSAAERVRHLPQTCVLLHYEETHGKSRQESGRECCSGKYKTIV